MSENTGSKRARTQQQDDTGELDVEPGRDQLLLTAPELQTRLGRKFVDESELLPLLLSHGLVRRVRTIEVHVRPLGGDSFKITLDASTPTVGEAKAEIARSQGTAAGRQELYKVAERADGLAVREDDMEPEPLDDESMVLADGEIVAMAVKESPHFGNKYRKPGAESPETGPFGRNRCRKPGPTSFSGPFLGLWDKFTRAFPGLLAVLVELITHPGFSGPLGRCGRSLYHRSACIYVIA
jgi:hypothetical protein